MTPDKSLEGNGPEALRINEVLFRNLVEQSLVGIHIIQDGRCCYANPRLAEMFGYSIAELLALRSWLDLVADEDRDFVANHLARRITGEASAAPWTFPGRRKDGSRIEIEVFGRRIEYRGRPAAFGLTLDVTERRHLEEQLHHAQKMESLGRLAGSVAHDFNNLLTVILGYADLAGLKLRPGDPLGESLAEIRRACERAGTLTRKLLTFSRREVVAPVVLDLNVLLRGIEDMVRRLVGENIDVRLYGDPALWRVRADVGHIEQVVMNLVVNARDAMPNDGKLTIETRNVTLDEDYERGHLDMPTGDCVLLAVSDTGQGMDEETQARIFEPFFTTKGPEQGTGLGLATVYGIVKKAGGGVQVYSEPGLGATFKVYLPRTADVAPAEAPALSAPRPRRGTETVLVAEDEDGLRMLVRVVLERHGYTVLEASDGTEALRRCERHTGPIHLLATDVVMPGPSGRELWERAARLRPGLKVLFLSGYTEEAIVRHGVLGAGLPFLHKPFTPDVLMHKVREALDAP